MGDEGEGTARSPPDEGGLDNQSIAAITLGILAWVSFLLAWFMLADAWVFLVLAVGFGTAALVLALRAKRDEQAALAAGATAAGAAMVYGMTLASLLTALIVAMGFLVILCILFLYWWMSVMAASSASCGWSGDCRCEGCGGCCEGGAGGCCGSSGCGDCGGGGCACTGLAIVPGLAAVLANASSSGGIRENLFRALREGAPHHPDLPQYDADVYRVGGARWCVGCFTTYPVFVLASAALLLAPAASGMAFAAGALLASLQAVSSAGLARWRAAKVAVKASLGLGLALLLHGVRAAAWAPGWKVAALAGILGLALLSAIPRARRMAKARARAARGEVHEACACGASTRAAP